MSPEQCNALIGALDAFEDPAVTTEDERKAARIVREACLDILNGGNLELPAEGEPLKLRLCRRVDVAFFHHLAPREKQVIAA